MIVIPKGALPIFNDTFKCPRNRKARMKIRVTGGAGFIGSNLASVLVKEHDVTVLDNFHTGSADNLNDVKNEITIVDDSSGNIGEQPSNSDLDLAFQRCAENRHHARV